jgi:hypothetical protein
LTLLVTPVVYSLLDDLAQIAWVRKFAVGVRPILHPLKNLLARRRKVRAQKEELEITAESGD